MRIIISGAKDFNDYNLLRDKMDSLTKSLTRVVVISNGHKGAAKLGIQWAYERMHMYIIHHPDMGIYGRKADHKVNEWLVGDADSVVVFGGEQEELVKDLLLKAIHKGLKTRRVEV